MKSGENSVIGRKPSKIPCLIIQKQAENLSKLLKNASVTSHCCLNSSLPRPTSENSFCNLKKNFTPCSTTSLNIPKTPRSTTLLNKSFTPRSITSSSETVYKSVNIPRKTIRSGSVETNAENIDINKNNSKSDDDEGISKIGILGNKTTSPRRRLLINEPKTCDGVEENIEQSTEESETLTETNENEFKLSTDVGAFVNEFETSDRKNSRHQLAGGRFPKKIDKYPKAQEGQATKKPIFSCKTPLKVNNGQPFGESDKINLVKVENKAAVLLEIVTELPLPWMDLTNKINQSRTKLVDFLIEKNLVSDVKPLTSESDSIIQDIEYTKLFTDEKMLLFTKSINQLFNDKNECEKLRQIVKSQSTKITTLSFQLKTADDLLKNSKSKADIVKSELENSYKRQLSEASSSKRTLVKHLQDKKASLEKALADLRKLHLHIETLQKTDEVRNHEDKNQKIISEPESYLTQNFLRSSLLSPEIEDGNSLGDDKMNHYNKNTSDKSFQIEMEYNDRSYRKQTKILKSTVKKLEHTVETLSAQNAKLREMVSSSETVGQSGDVTERGLANALTTILHDKQRDVEKLSDIVHLMQRHCTASHLQRCQLEARLAALKSQVITKQM